jgi:hypothetical protein
VTYSTTSLTEWRHLSTCVRQSNTNCKRGSNTQHRTKTEAATCKIVALLSYKIGIVLNRVRYSWVHYGLNLCAVAQVAKCSFLASETRVQSELLWVRFMVNEGHSLFHVSPSSSGFRCLTTFPPFPHTPHHRPMVCAIPLTEQDVNTVGQGFISDPAPILSWSKDCLARIYLYLHFSHLCVL